MANTSASLGQTPRPHRSTELLPRDSLSISNARELLVTAGIPAAYRPDRGLAADTRRLWAPTDRLPDPNVPERLAEEVVGVYGDEVVWGGGIVPHYGHFITESVSRLWPLLPGRELEGRPVVFATPLEHPVVSDWLGAFGAQPVELPERGAIAFTRMRVPQPAWRLNAWIAPEIRDIHLHARSGLNVPHAAGGVVWMSRSKLRPEVRAHDELLLEWLLRTHVTVIHPETMTLVEQVAAIESGDAVAGLVGSAFHTLLMALSPPPCLGLSAGTIIVAYLAQMQLLSPDSRFVCALVPPERNRRLRRGRLGGHVCSIPTALRALAVTVLPALREEPGIAPLLTSDGRRAAATAGLGSPIAAAAAKVALDPYAFEARMELGGLFEERGLADAAIEQYIAVVSLSDEGAAVRRRADRLLSRS